MFSSIVKIGLVALLALALVGGSAYVLLRPGAEGAEWQSAERGQAAPQARGNGGPAAGEQAAAAGQGGTQGQSRGSGEVQGAPASEASKSTAAAQVTRSGEVVALDDELTVLTEGGALEVHLGPSWHWEAAGIALRSGDQVEVVGFYEEDDFMAVRVDNLTTGQSVTLRSASGRPSWAGGRQQGR